MSKPFSAFWEGCTRTTFPSFSIAPRINTSETIPAIFFFGKLQTILGDREDIKIVGDRFIFESELLFDSASANLQIEGREKWESSIIK